MRQSDTDIAPAPRTIETPLGCVPVVARACPACGAGNREVAGGRFSRDPWQIKDCPSCGFVYLDPVPHYEALNETLAWNKSWSAERERRNAERPIASRISQVTRRRNRILPRRDIARLAERHAPPGNVVDIGCAEGSRVVTIAEPYVPYGIEIAADLARHADQLLTKRGGRCLHAPALVGLKSFPDGFFTAALLRSYLEHEVRPREVLDELGRTLAFGGVAIVKVPNYDSLNRRLAGRSWCGFRYPDHVNYFTPRSLTRMAEAAGFGIRFGALGALPTSDNMWAVLRRL